MGVRENTITPFTKIQSEFGSLNSPRLDVQQEDVKNRGSLGLICHVFLSAFFISRFEKCNDYHFPYNLVVLRRGEGNYCTILHEIKGVVCTITGRQ